MRHHSDIINSAVGAKTAFLAFLDRFARDRRGAIAILFSFTFIIIVGIVGGAVDYARWLAARSQTIRAMDAAVLAGGRQLLVSKTASQSIQVATIYYNENKTNYLDTNSVTFVVNSAGTEIKAISDTSLKTPFLAFAGVPELPIREESRALIQTGANAGQSVEIALMLDTTGSMAGSKMTALKQAAADLVNIVIWDDQSEFTSKVAIVPFAPYVNVGNDLIHSTTNWSPSNSTDSQTCVKERQGSNRYTDAAPNETNGFFDRYMGYGTCSPQAVLLPLTNNKQDLVNRIDSMYPTGATAGHLGTAWTWYALSPNFASVWPEASRPKSYAMLTELNDQHQPKLNKVAVLMTDGEYNTVYSGNSSATQAQAICSAMKSTGITVYTIGFEISGTGNAYQTLSSCASAPDYFYTADDADSLRSAFRDIALKIATLRLTQ